MAGELRLFDGIWMNDHLTDLEDDRSGPSLESLTVAATLAHHVPGHWIGHSVLSNTFRHPALLAKQAAVLDQATGGRFILGLGAGWHEFEHRAFGIPLPPLKERIDRLESAVGVLRALFSDAASAPPGVTRDDPFYPLRGATLEPGPVQAGGPPSTSAARARAVWRSPRARRQGWLVPGVNADDPSYLAGEARRPPRPARDRRAGTRTASTSWRRSTCGRPGRARSRPRARWSRPARPT